MKGKMVLVSRRLPLCSAPFAVNFTLALSSPAAPLRPQGHHATARKQCDSYKISARESKLSFLIPQHQFSAHNASLAHIAATRHPQQHQSAPPDFDSVLTSRTRVCSEPKGIYQRTNVLRLAMAQYSPEESRFIITALGVGIALYPLVPILVETSNWYWDLHLNPIAAFILAVLWAHPKAFYLLFHPVTLPLPTWLTSEHPVTFGGVAPNICTSPTLMLKINTPGGWPCFPAHLKDSLVHLVGPGGWKYLVILDAELILCLIFLAFHIVLILVWIFPPPKPCLDAERAHATCELCGQEKVDVKASEKSDIEKQ